MKGKKTDLTAKHCGIARSLGVIGDWWSLLIVRDAFAGTRRFGGFQKSLGLAKNILSARLKKLVAEGIFRTEPEEDGSAFNAYVLTAKGEQLGIVLAALWQWGEENCFAKGELNRVMVDRNSNEPLARIGLRTTTGRELTPRDVAMVARDSVRRRAAR